MTDNLKTALGIMIPFIGTTLGAAMVFFLRRGLGDAVKKALLGFASGVMTAASVWSLMIPSIEMASSRGALAWFPAAAGFLLGIFFLLILDRIIPRMYMNFSENERTISPRGRSAMLTLAVTLHNIPEGMAVGVAFAGALSGEHAVTMTEALVLSLGIAIQNLPEGSIISMPLRADGMSKGRAFLYGTLSGAVEPAGAILTIVLTSVISPALPYILSFAAGAMIYVVVGELIPEAREGDHTEISMIGLAAGFLLMMILDVSLG